MIRITLPDGSMREARPGIRVRDAAVEMGFPSGESAVCASVNGQLRGARERLTEDCALAIYTANTPEGYRVLCHSAAHVAAHAVKRLFPTAVLGMGGPTTDGFYHEFDIGRLFHQAELEEIEVEMSHIVDADLPIKRFEMSKGDARMLLIRLGEVLRLELLDKLSPPIVSLYKQGDYIDLCRGPHLSSTGGVPPVHLTRLATSYWLDDPHAERLNRIHGTIA